MAGHGEIELGDMHKKAKMILQWVELSFKALGRQTAMDGLERKKF